MDRLHISATGHSLNYLPHYTAEAQGYFRDRDLEVTLESPPQWDGVIESVCNGRSDIALGGLWIPMTYHRRIRELRAVAQIAGRCPFVAVSRSRERSYGSGLRDGTHILIPGDNGPGRYVFVVGELRKAGVDVRRLVVTRDMPAPLCNQLFSGGLGDILITDFSAASAIAREQPDVTARFLTASGQELPWSAYFAPEESLKRRREVIARYLDAIRAATRFIMTAPVSQLAGPAETLFSNVDGAMEKAIDEFRHGGMWNPTLEVGVDGYNWWHDQLLVEGYLGSEAPYDTIVRSDLFPAKPA